MGWSSYDLASMVKRLGETRVMFGTDLVNNVAVELAKYRSIGLSDGQLEWCFHTTAETVFRIA
jgi:predicted TIM-barrel fold metal-dependent hydrolase